MAATKTTKASFCPVLSLLLNVCLLDQRFRLPSSSHHPSPYDSLTSMIIFYAFLNCSKGELIQLERENSRWRKTEERRGGGGRRNFTNRTVIMLNLRLRHGTLRDDNRLRKLNKGGGGEREKGTRKERFAPGNNKGRGEGDVDSCSRQVQGIMLPGTKGRDEQYAHRSNNLSPRAPRHVRLILGHGGGRTRVHRTPSGFATSDVTPAQETFGFIERGRATRRGTVPSK